MKRPTAQTLWPVAMALLVVLGLFLRLRGFHNPILDHPGWRQGDTAAIARNFATRQFNILYPQVDYDGPPPNYVELELQIVPFLAATLYKVFGIHPGFGRAISIAFGLGTIVVTGAFARWLFCSTVAGVAAAAIFAVLPGSMYYSRTFMPDTTMVFFLTAAIYACTRFLWTSDARSWRGFWIAALLLLTALLAKPVAIIALVPIAAIAIARFGVRAALARPQHYALLAVALLPLVAYDTFVNAHAEWHWASGITRKHVLPALQAAFTSKVGLMQKWIGLQVVLRMLGRTMLGPFGIAFLLIGFAIRYHRREAAVLYGWLAAAIGYSFVVVTVERVDYYLYPILPLAALVGGDACSRLWLRARSLRAWPMVPVAALMVYLAMIVTDSRLIAPYYTYNHANYRSARNLDATLAPQALVVMGHYDPSILYYINRKGWEEDPFIWTPFDEQSAIRKGARYFIAVEGRRLQKNRELFAWLARFPVENTARWPVYTTDPAHLLPGAGDHWRAFRKLERASEKR